MHKHRHNYRRKEKIQCIALILDFRIHLSTYLLVCIVQMCVMLMFVCMCVPYLAAVHVAFEIGHLDLGFTHSATLAVQ